jgi:ketosteroid isomerase-like protein
MNTILTKRWPAIIIALSFAVITIACGRSAPLQDGSAVASEPTAAWVTAFNGGDATVLAALYAENARSLPPGGPAVTGRSQIESYWRGDLGDGGVTTTLTPADAVAQGDLVHVDGTYQVKGKSGAELANGQYQQLWTRADGGPWQVQREMWRIDPALHRESDVADRLTSAWTTAYNAGDPKALLALYADDAALSTVQDGTTNGKPAIEAFWVGDFGATKPSSTLTLTDAYVVGELAHLEGDYKVADSGKITQGRYIQLWMRDADGWRIHREMWWR